VVQKQLAQNSNINIATGKRGNKRKTKKSKLKMATGTRG
jgi:hypothetical protein